MAKNIEDISDIDALAEALAVDVAEESLDPGEKHAPRDDDEGWLPRLNPTQMEIFYDDSDVIAAYGPKFTGKTIGATHRITRHLYEEWDAFYIILGVSYAALRDGVCHDIESLTLPTWAEGNREPEYIYDKGILVPNPKAGELMDHGIGLEYQKWKLDPATKHLHLKIKNRFGGWSRIRAMSVPHPDQVEPRIKGPAPSGVYLEEATDTGSKSYVTYPRMQLYRRRDIQGPQQLILSCNPRRPSWVYDWLWEECVVASGGRVWPHDRVKPGIRRDESISVYFVPYEENRHNVNQKNREQLESELRTNPTLKQRLIDGLWVEMPSGEAMFKDEYADSKHLFGNADKNLGLTPIKGLPIVLSYDPGWRHTGIALMQCIETASGPFWMAFDSLCYHGKRIPYFRLTRGLLTKLAYWNRRMGYKFEHIHITDEAAITQFNPNTGSTTAKDLEEFSKNIINAEPQFADIKPFRLIGCPKPPGSVEARVDLMKDLLIDRRIAVSAMCKPVRAMFLHLEHEDKEPMRPKRTENAHPHTFDAVSYAVYFRRHLRPRGFRESGSTPAVSVSTGR